MKTIGLIGGMSWESSAHYYRIINQAVRTRLGGARSARSLMLSVDFGEIERLQHAGDWKAFATAMVEAAQALERGGADFLLICTNTMHKVADDVTAAVALPLLHIADPTGRRSGPPDTAKSACSAPPSRWSRHSTAIGSSSGMGWR